MTVLCLAQRFPGHLSKEESRECAAVTYGFVGVAFVSICFVDILCTVYIL